MVASLETRTRDAAVLALTLHAEPVSRSVRALEALAALIMNRVAAQAQPWGKGVEGVCRAPFQFPRWALRRLAICRRIAARAVSGVLADPTNGATHYHGDDAQPSWAMTQVPIAEIGGLLFYRLELPTQPVTPCRPSLATCC